jgi:hypothetical protein
MLRRFKWRNLVLIGGMIISFSACVLAGTCYRNAWYGPALSCTTSGNIGPTGPCPYVPNMTSPPIPGCGFFSYRVAVPRGTVGNEPDGRLAQGFVVMTCEMTVSCSSTPLLVRPFPPIWKTACVSGPAVPSGTAAISKRQVVLVNKFNQLRQLCLLRVRRLPREFNGSSLACDDGGLYSIAIGYRNSIHCQ